MKKYSLGVFLNIFNKNRSNWEEQIRFINSLKGVDHVEIMLEETELNTSDISFLKDNLLNYNLILHAPFMDITLLSIHNEISRTSFSVFKKAILIGGKLGVKAITLHMDKFPSTWEKKEAEKRTIFWIKKLAKISPFPISIENLSFKDHIQTTYPSTKDDILRLVKLIPKNSGLTIDTGHLLHDTVDPIEVLKQTHKSVLNIHLHDGKKGSAHLKLGDGNLNLQKFFSFLRKINYKGFISIEVIGKKEIRESWEIATKYNSFS